MFAIQTTTLLYNNALYLSTNYVNTFIVILFREKGENTNHELQSIFENIHCDFIPNLFIFLYSKSIFNSRCPTPTKNQ